MKKKKLFFPKSLLKNLVDDINRLIHSNDGRMLLLEIMEEIPLEVRDVVIEGLSSFYQKSVADFIYIVKAEYGQEIEGSCNRALEKFALAGVDITPPRFGSETFYKAYASDTRHTGRIAVDVAWRIDAKTVVAECFYLSFHYDGIHSFFIIDRIPVSQFDADRETAAGMVELSYDEVCSLLAQSYALNLSTMSRPALGRFIYQKYLNKPNLLSPEEEKDLTRKLLPQLTPGQIVNSIFYAWKHHDYSYIASLVANKEINSDILTSNIGFFADKSIMLLEAHIHEIKNSARYAKINAHGLYLREQDCWQEDFCFHMAKDKMKGWSITDFKRSFTEPITSRAAMDPFNVQVYCRVYDIINLEGLFDFLDHIDNIKIMEGMPYGMHMCIAFLDDDLSLGVSLLRGVVADLVVNGNEFVIIAREKETIKEFQQLLQTEPNMPLIVQGEYEVPLMTAYSYLTGQYIDFEDVLLAEDSDLCFKDGMRFISACYYIRNYEMVESKIKSLAKFSVDMGDGCQVYYQMDTDGQEEPRFLGEYILEPHWVSLSAFGYKDMHKARDLFEKNLHGCLEFDGVEIREQGIFDVLTNEVKKEYPELENTLKEMYLNKWYHSHLTDLSGLSPLEASKTEEGNRLLWTMFKQISQKKRGNSYMAKAHRIKLHEYIQMVEKKVVKKVDNIT